MPDNKQYSGGDRRKDFRLKYPKEFHPKLFFRSEEYDVEDISEHGIRFHYSEASKLHSARHLLQNATARLRFTDGDTLDFEGDIYRIEDDFAVLFLIKGIPYEKIKAERKAIEGKFPEHF